MRDGWWWFFRHQASLPLTESSSIKITDHHVDCLCFGLIQSNPIQQLRVFWRMDLTDILIDLTLQKIIVQCQLNMIPSQKR